MAGINSAGVNGPGVSAQARGGIFSPMARRQYRALGRMRWRMFQNGMRTNQGVLELGARTVSMLIYAGIGFGLSVGMGFGSYAMVSGHQWAYLPILFWAVFMIWQMLPILLASFQEQFDLSILLRFPVSFGPYMLLYLIFGLVDVSTIAGSLACLGLFTGITVAQPGLFAWTALALAIFAAFNILLARAVFAWIDRWLAQRRTREIVGAIFLLAMLSLQMLNPAFHERRRTGPVSHEDHAASPRELEERYMPWLHRANAIQRWLPPGLAVQAVRRAGEVTRSGEGNGAPISGSIAAGALGSLESLGVLAVWMLATGGVLAARLKSEYAGENLGQAPARQKAQSRESGRQLGGSGPIAAVIEKDLRALLRTLPLLYAVGAPLLLMAIFSGAFLHGIGPRGNVFALALPLCLVYAQLGFTQVFYNNLGTEGAGIQIYFLSPTPMRSVMLAKNLFHGALFWLVALTAGVLASLRLGVPQPAVIAATAAWLMFSLPCNLAAGNIFSLTMPYRVNPGRMARQRGSQANALLSLLVQLGILSVGAAVFALTYFLDRLWLAAPIFLVMAAMAMAVWRRLLANVDGMAAQRREMLMEKLTKIS